MYNQWVIDATLYNENDGMLCFVPIENAHTDQETLVLGLNILSDLEHFDHGKVIGVIHLDGQEAADIFCNEHPEIIENIKRKITNNEN